MGGEDAVAQKGRTRKALLALVAGLDWVCACVVSRCWAVVKHGHRGFGHTQSACLFACLPGGGLVWTPAFFAILLGMTRQDKTRDAATFSACACPCLVLLAARWQALRAVRGTGGLERQPRPS